MAAAAAWTHVRRPAMLWRARPGRLRHRVEPAGLRDEIVPRVCCDTDAPRAEAARGRAVWRATWHSKNKRLFVRVQNILLVGPTGCGKSEVRARALECLFGGDDSLFAPHRLVNFPT